MAINDELRHEFLAKQRDRKYCAMREFRTKLPAFDKCHDILDKISNNQVLVISGETGCGKTTQVCISRVEGVGEGEGGGIVVVIGGCTMFWAILDMISKNMICRPAQKKWSNHPNVSHSCIHG